MERRSSRRVPTLRDLQLLRRIGALVLSLLTLAAIAAPAAAQRETLRIGHFPNITHVQALVAPGQGLVRGAARIRH